MSSLISIRGNGENVGTETKTTEMDLERAKLTDGDDGFRRSAPRVAGRPVERRAQARDIGPHARLRDLDVERNECARPREASPAQVRGEIERLEAELAALRAKLREAEAGGAAPSPAPAQPDDR